MHFKFNKGLSLPLTGQPGARIDTAGEINSVAVLGGDYIGLKPTMLVQQGDRVKQGTPLFEDKKNPGVTVCSPAAGSVAAINRGAQRALVSVVINIDGDEAEQFGELNDEAIASLDSAQACQTLQKSGLWVAFRTRPYGKVPAVNSQPHSIFINAMDSNPLAGDPQVVIQHRSADFTTGVSILAKFGVPTYVCQAAGAELPALTPSNVKLASFQGPHPAGLASTHVHSIDPVNANKTVWTIGYQDVIAIGKLFTSGRLDNSRYIALGGAFVNSPRIFETIAGANIEDLLEGRLLENRVSEGDKQAQIRVISGSILNGHHATGQLGYLGRYDNQVTIIEENTEREFMGWILPGKNKFSAINVFISSLLKPKHYDFTSSQNGSPRAIVPIGVFEKVMPLDILATPLLKSLLVKDTDTAQELGCLELVEEDLALCSFVDPGKHDFGPVLRSTLTQIEREG